MDLYINSKLSPQEIADVWTNERLLNVVEQFIGPEIAGHPIWNIRTKVSLLVRVSVL